MIKLKTNRLIIRDAKPEDFNGWHRLMSEPKNMYYLDDIMTHSPEESKQNLDAAIEEAMNPNRTKYFFAVELMETGAFIGSIGYTVEEVTPVGKIAGAGYFFLPEFQGKGYTTEAFKEVIRFAFEENDVFRLKTGCFSDNKASERVMQKSGLVKEAEYKSCAWHDGNMKDRVSYRLLRGEWLAGNNSDSFWTALDTLVSESEIVIDRPRGSAHRRYPNFIYPLDYGYLKNTSAMDGGGIDIWRGSYTAGRIDAIMCIIDLVKRDSEIKILIGCTEEEKVMVYQTHNETEFMKGVLIRR